MQYRFQAAIPPGLLDGCQVLVVDDEPLNVELVQSLMASMGVEVRSAGDGAEALRVLEEFRSEIDVVLMDVMMPVMDGFDTCAKIRSNPLTTGLPVLLVTALTGQADRLRGIENGANDFLTKPLVAQEVLLRVVNALVQKRLADRLAVELDRLKGLESMRDALVHMVVHDLRSPLAAVQLNLQLLARDAGLRPDQREVLDDSLEGVERMGGLVTTMLDISRLEHGRFPLARRHLDLAETVSQAVARVESLAGPRTLAVDTPPLGSTCWFDEEIVRRVVENLVINAVKATPPTGSIHVALRRDGDFAMVEVRDDGKGIPADQRDRVFDKFGQVTGGAGRPRASWGLGLTFVRMAVEAHGGRIDFESEVGCGTRFWFLLPLGEGS